MKKFDLEQGLLKTSFGLSKRFEHFYKPLGIYVPGKDEKIKNSVTAISLFYKVSKRVATYYYMLISNINKSKIVEIKRKVGVE